MEHNKSKYNLKDLPPQGIVSLFTHFYDGGDEKGISEFMMEFMELSESYQSHVLSKCTVYIKNGLEIKIMESRLEITKMLVMESESPDQHTAELAEEDMIRMEVKGMDGNFIDSLKNKLIINYFK